MTLNKFLTLTSAAAISAGLAAIAAPSSAMAGPLFKASNASENAEAENRFKADKALKRKRLVDVDLSEIEANILPRGADRAADRAQRSARLAGQVSFELFPGETVTLKARHVDEAFAGGVVWTGDAGGGGGGILVVNNGRVTASIDVNGKTFIIEPTGRGSEHRVKEVDTEAYPDDYHLEIGAAPKTKGGGGGSGKGKGGTTTTDGGTTDGGTTGGTTTTVPPEGTILEIDLLAAYTVRANTILTNIPADKIALDVAVANQAYINSKVPIHLNLVGVTPVSSTYDEKAVVDSVQPLRDLTSGTVANFAAIRDMRTALAADLVTMYIDRSEYCGYAWINGTPPNPDRAFSVMNASCVGSVSLVHELGHNMGLRHDRYVETATGSDVYNYGFVNTTGRFRDIMSYSTQCSSLGIPCTRISYFSNAKLQYNGYPLGIPQGVDGAADASRKLAEQATAVSKFR